MGKLTSIYKLLQVILSIVTSSQQIKVRPVKH
jgi:hypothetical protein